MSLMVIEPKDSSTSCLSWV